MLTCGVSLQAAAAATGFFRTPSHNIACFYEYGAHVASPLLECGIASGLRPRPPRSGPGCKDSDYTADEILLDARGVAEPVACSGDAGPFADPSAPVLGYGTIWRGGGDECSSARTGLTCTNAAGHGFFLSRAAWHRV